MELRCVKILVLILAVSLSGCAKIKVTKLDNEESYTEGIRFYRGLPYLAVVDSGGQCAATVIYLPDTRTEYVARTIMGIGSVNLTAKLEGGILLTEFGAASDSKASEILVAAITGLAGMKAAEAGNAAECKSAGLYWLAFDPVNGRVKEIGKVNFP